MELWTLIAAIAAVLVGAAGIWLQIAGNKRTVDWRSEDKNEDSRAHAELVTIHQGARTGDSKVALRIENGGPTTITRLTLVDAIWVNAPPDVATWKLVPTIAWNLGVRPRLDANGQQTFVVEFLNEDGRRVTVPRDAELTARVEFVDTPGLRWSRVAQEQPRRID